MFVGMVSCVGCSAFQNLVSLPKGSSSGMGTCRPLPHRTKRIGAGLETSVRSRSRYGAGLEQVITVHLGLIGMVSGDETLRRTNEKPTRSTLTAYGPTAT